MRKGVRKVWDADARRWLWVKQGRGGRVTYVKPVGGWRKGDRHD